MKKNIIKSVIYTSVIIFSVIFIYTLNEPSEIVCRSSFRTISIADNINVSLNISYTLGDDEGWVNIKGKLRNNNIESDIARKVYLDFIRIGDSIKIRSTKNIILSSDNTNSIILEKYITQPYLKSNSEMDIFLYPQKSGGYIFFTNDMYSFYCK